MYLNFKKTKNIFFFLIFFLVVLKFFNAFYNSYSIVLWNYDKRMTESYGYCKNESWGFYNDVIKRYNLENKKINIINNEGFVELDALFKNLNITNKDYEYLIILNFQSENDQDIYNMNVKGIENFKVKYRFNNCYLLGLND